MSRDVEAGNAYVRVSLRGLDKASRKFKRWGAKLTSAGIAMTAAGTALAVPFAMAVKAFADFDDAMRAVKAVTIDGASNFKRLNEVALQLGETTSFTSQEVATLMTILGRANFSSDQIIKMTGAVLNLARATGTDAALAADVLGKSLTQFGLDAKDAGMSADLLTTAANRSFNTVEDLGESLKFAAPTARQFGISMKDTLAIVGTLGNIGIQGTMAGTMLRRMMVESGANAEKMGKIFGTTFRDASGDVIPFIEILEIIAEKTKDLGSGERAAKLNEAFGLRGITGVSALTQNLGDVKGLTEALDNAGGTAEEVAKAMDAGLGGAFRLLVSKVESLKIKIGRALSPTLILLFEQFREGVGVVAEFVTQNQVLVVGILGAVAALITAGVSLVAFGLALKVVAIAVAALSATVALLFSPAGLLVVGLAAGAAAFLKFSEAGKAMLADMKEDFGRAFSTITDTISGISDALKGGQIKLAGEIAMTGLKLAFEEAIVTIKTKWIEFNKSLVSTLTNAGKELLNTFRDITNAIAGFIGNLVQVEMNRSIDSQTADAMRMIDERLKSGRITEEQAAAAREKQRGIASRGKRSIDRDPALDLNNALFDKWEKQIDNFGGEVSDTLGSTLDEAVSESDAKIAALSATLEQLRMEASNAEAAAAAAISEEIKEDEEKKRIPGGGGGGPGGAGASAGTFSAAGAAIAFQTKQVRPIDKSIEANTRRAAKLLDRIHRRRKHATFS